MSNYTITITRDDGQELHRTYHEMFFLENSKEDIGGNVYDLWHQLTNKENPKF